MRVKPKPVFKLAMEGSRMTAPERQLVEAAAAVASTTLSDFVRQAAVSTAKDIVARAAAGARQGTAA